MTGFRGQPVPGSGRAPKPQAPNKRFVVPFEDNRHLTRLLGEYDAHLALIEDRLGIEAHAHGNVVILNGPETACAIAREVLEDLFGKDEDGEPSKAERLLQKFLGPKE